MKKGQALGRSPTHQFRGSTTSRLLRGSCAGALPSPHFPTSGTLAVVGKDIPLRHIGTPAPRARDGEGFSTDKALLVLLMSFQESVFCLVWFRHTYPPVSSPLQPSSRDYRVSGVSSLRRHQGLGSADQCLCRRRCSLPVPAVTTGSRGLCSRTRTSTGTLPTSTRLARTSTRVRAAAASVSPTCLAGKRGRRDWEAHPRA